MLVMLTAHEMNKEKHGHMVEKKNRILWRMSQHFEFIYLFIFTFRIMLMWVCFMSVFSDVYYVSL